jgi:radical SAM protein with 4Fe4S-binding SPASM domain
LRAPRVPYKCVWEITRRCNLRCVHCENRSGPRSPDELSDGRLQQVAMQLAALGCREAVVTGGEPLLRPAWSDVCRALSGAGVKVSLVTNGTLLDREMLAEARAAGVGVVGISIDGMQATHDGIRPRETPGASPWAETVAALERCAQALPTVAITQVNRLNLEELPDVGRLLAELGVKRWQVQLAIPMGRVRDLPGPFALEPEHLEQLVAFLVRALRDPGQPLLDVSDTIGYCTGEDALFRGRRRDDGTTQPGVWLGCTAGLTALAITYDGRVRGCSMMPPELDAGSLHDESLAAIWNDASRFSYSTEFHPDRLRGRCARCKLGGLCRGGCTTMAYWSTGTVAENPYCLRAQRGAP